MWHTRLASIGTTIAFLLVGLTVQAQGQAVQVSGAWARRAPMGHMGATSKGDAPKGHTGAMSKSGADKGSTGAMSKGGAGMSGTEHSHMGGGTAAVYVVLTNPGTQAHALVSATSDAAKTVELHETRNEAGVMKMRPVKSIRVPPGGKVEMKPGGYHIMLIGLTHDLKPGDTVAVTLKFDQGPEVSVDAPVK